MQHVTGQSPNQTPQNMNIADEAIIVEFTYETTPNHLWKALTDPSEMVKWYFKNIPDFKAEVGFKTSFAVKVEDRTFTHLWEVTEVIPGESITYGWKYEEYDGDGFVNFKLIEEEDGVRLRLTDKILKSYPDDIPEFERDSGVEGWNFFLGESLKKYVEEGTGVAY